MTSRPSTAPPMKVGRFATVALAVLGFMPVLYVATYLALVEPVLSDEDERGPRYGFGGVFVERFFAPAHAIDRQLRPKVWTVPIYIF
jgi:hypothetical protein